MEKDTAPSSSVLRAPGRWSALDYDGTALRHIGKVYPELKVLQGNLVQQGLADDAFDLVVSMQTIEHLWDQPAFVAECARVVRPARRRRTDDAEPAHLPDRGTGTTPGS